MIRGVSIVANYIFSILVIRQFSDEIYGQYVVGLSVFMLLSVFLKSGVDVHFVKIFAEFDPKSIPKWVKAVENRVVFLSIAISLFIIGGIYLFYPSAEEANVLILFILSVPFHVKILINSGKLRGISRITEFAFLNIAGRILFTLLFLGIFYLTILKENSHIVYISHLVAILILLIISIVWTRNEFNFSKSKETISIPKEFLSYNKGLLLKSYVTVFFLWGDRFLLSFVADPKEIAQYDISLKIAMIIMIVAEALKSTYAPVFAKYAPDSEQFQMDVKKSARLGFGFSVLLFFIILIFGKFLLGLFDPQFKDSYGILLVISLGYTVASFFGQSDNILEMTGWIKHYLVYYFLIIILSLALGVLLSNSIGAMGMAIGIALGNIIFQGIASYIVKTKIGIKTTFI